jgi:predicted transcriptional regulator
MAKTTVEFSDQAADELASMAEKLSTSKANVLRDALSLYVFIVEELRSARGRQLGIVEDEDKIKKIIVVPGVRVGSPQAVRA